jgi:hypothetical protein
MTKQPFNNNSSQAEKQQVLRQERKTSTYFSQAKIAQELEMGGRFAAEGRPSFVGETPAALYPRLPASSPWACDPVPRSIAARSISEFRRRPRRG